MGNEKHIFVVNPMAGKRSCEEEIEDFVKKYQGRGVQCDCFVTLEKGEGELFVRQSCYKAARKNEFIFFYACGGDGTLNEVVNGVMASGETERVAVTHIPRGSGNDFIKYFDHPERFSKLENFMKNEIVKQKVDVIKVNQRYCLNICSAGLDARIGTNIDQFRRHWWLSGKKAYLASAVSNILQGINKTITITYQSRKGTLISTTAERAMVCVANGAFYGGSFHPVPEAKIDDGILDVLIVDDVQINEALPMLLAYKNGNYWKYPDKIHHVQVKKLRIRTPKPEPLNIDGEALVTEDAEIEILASKLTFFYPLL